MFPPHIATIARRELPTMVGAVGLAVVAGVLELAPHALVAMAAYTFLGDGLPAWMPSFSVAVTLCMIAILLRFGLMGTSLILSHQASFRLARRLRIAMGERFARAPMHRVVQIAPGDAKKAMLDDAAAVGGILEHSIPDVVSAVMVPLLSAVFLFFLDWRMALASLALLPLATVVQGLVMSGMGELFAEWQATEKRATEAVIDFLRGLVVLKTFDREAASMTRLTDAVFGIRNYAVSITRRSNVGYVAFMVLFSSNLVVLLPIGLYFVQRGTLGPAALATFVVVGTGITAPLLKLLFLFGSVQMNKTRLARIEAVLALPDLDQAAKNQKEETPLPDGELAIEGLTFRYRAGRPAVLDDVSLVAAPGARIGLVGPSGAGKSTLARMLVGDWQAEAGAVRLGGTDLASLPKRVRGRLIGYVGQTTFLLRASVRDNVRLGAKEATDEAIWAALDAAGVADVIEALPGGLDATLGPGGGGLSGGERQRLAIARTALQDPRILILDEATAHLDPLAEAKVHEGLARLMEGRTTLMVAHRLQTVQDADLIVVMANGAVVDQGRHDDLLERCDVYRDLWRRQQAAATWRLTAGATGSVVEGVA
ncbi:MAG: ABC transporter ATP-binding protein [Myxococcota bacterium]